MNIDHTIFLRVNPFIFARKKGMQKVYEKLLAHPLFISDYVVYYARVARTFILVSLLCVCVCVCVCVTQLFGLTK